MKRTTVFYGLKNEKGYVSDIKTTKYEEESVVNLCFTDSILDAKKLTSYNEAEIYRNSIAQELEIFQFEVTCEESEIKTK